MCVGGCRHDDSFSAEEKRQSRDIKKSCNLNLAAAYLKLQRPMDARKAADKVSRSVGRSVGRSVAVATRPRPAHPAAAAS